MRMQAIVSKCFLWPGGLSGLKSRSLQLETVSGFNPKQNNKNMHVYEQLFDNYLVENKYY